MDSYKITPPPPRGMRKRIRAYQRKQEHGNGVNSTINTALLGLVSTMLFGFGSFISYSSFETSKTSKATATDVAALKEDVKIHTVQLAEQKVDFATLANALNVRMEEIQRGQATMTTQLAVLNNRVGETPKN